MRRYSWDYDEHYDIWEYSLADKSLKNLTNRRGYDAEGGWSPAELALAEHAGCAPLALGPRVLRTETAGLAALAALQTLWGDFAGDADV